MNSTTNASAMARLAIVAGGQYRLTCEDPPANKQVSAGD